MLVTNCLGSTSLDANILRAIWFVCGALAGLLIGGRRRALTR
jgi:hypothetical protein